jgi:hypothetical protein
MWIGKPWGFQGSYPEWKTDVEEPEEDEEGERA